MPVLYNDLALAKAFWGFADNVPITLFFQYFDTSFLSALATRRVFSSCLSQLNTSLARSVWRWRFDVTPFLGIQHRQCDAAIVAIAAAEFHTSGEAEPTKTDLACFPSFI